MTQHDLIYRLITAEDWTRAQETGVLPWRDVDHKDGYFHLCTDQQCLETADLHFMGVKNLLALAIDADEVADKLKWEPSRGGALFPHYYGELGADHVARAVPLRAEPDGSFRFDGGGA